MSAEKERRTEILAAAGRLLRHYGFTKTTVSDIAREARIGVGTVYLEFESKDAIVAALSEAQHAEVLAAMRSAAADRRRHSDRLCAALDARIKAFIEIADGGHHAKELVHCVCPAVVEAHQRFKKEEAALIARILEEGHSAGELAVPDAAATAEVLMAAYAAFSPPALYAFPSAEVERLLPRLHDLILTGVVRRKR